MNITTEIANIISKDLETVGTYIKLIQINQILYIKTGEFVIKIDPDATLKPCQLSLNISVINKNSSKIDEINILLEDKKTLEIVEEIYKIVSLWSKA